MWEGVVATIVALVLGAFFRMLQLGIQVATGRNLRMIGRSNPRRWAYARLIRANASNYLLACQIGFFVSALLLGFALAVAWWPVVNTVVLPSKSLEVVAVGALMLTSAIIPLFFLQILRSIAYTYPERTLLTLSGAGIVAASILSPIIRSINAIVEWLDSVLGLKFPCERQIFVPAEDIREIVEITGDGGEIEDEEREMIKGVVLLSDTLVNQVMTPRSDIVSVSCDSSLAEVFRTFEKEKLSRLIVSGDSLDDVRGVVHLKDLLIFIEDPQRPFKLESVARPPHAITGTMKIDEALKDFRARAVHLAIVLDEHGGVDGLITVEDLLEEIVGEIFDEFDSPADEIEIKKTKTGDFLVDGSISIDAFNRRFRAHLPQVEFSTLAGFLLHHLSRMPEVGEVVDVQGFRIRVEVIDQNRLTVLRVLKRKRPYKIPKDGEESAESKAAPSESKSFETESAPKQGILGSR